jgi:hypothetical protein
VQTVAEPAIRYLDDRGKTELGQVVDLLTIDNRYLSMASDALVHHKE